MPRPLHRKLIAIFTALVLAGSAFGGEVETRASTRDVLESETFQVLLRYRGDTPARPDLTPLDADFDVVDVGTSQRTSVVNGVRDESVDWILTLAPLRKGTLSVPELTVGDARSKAFDVRVGEAAAGAAAPGSGAPVLLEVEVDDEHPYVQGRVKLTARVYLDESVKGGALTEPELEGALLERSGEDERSSVLRDGKRYTLIERQYALFPQASGSVRVPPLSFEGTRQSDPGRGARRSPFDDAFGGSIFDDFFGGSRSPFGRSMLDDLFDDGQRIRVRSNAIELDVRARPQEAGGAWWLPARHVELVEEWEPDPPTFRVGEQVTRRIAIQALGLSGSQMPELELPEVDGLKQYALPSRDDTLASGDETVAVELREFALLPTRAGELVLPKIEVAWWDVEADEARTASLPERRVQVLAGDGSAVAATAPASEPAPPPPAPARSDCEPTSAGEPRSMPYASLGAAALLALAGMVVLRRRRRIPREVVGDATAPSLRQAERELQLACTQGDPSAASAALIAVGRARWPEDPPRHPAEVARRLQDVELAGAVDSLMRARFASEPSGWDSGDLLRAYFRASRAGRRRRETGRRELLPALYPTP